MAQGKAIQPYVLAKEAIHLLSRQSHDPNGDAVEKAAFLTKHEMKNLPFKGDQRKSYRRILVTAKGFRRRRFGSERMPD
jgi:hypothetical protein